MFRSPDMYIGTFPDFLAVDPADVDKTIAAINEAGEKAFVIGKAVAGEKGVTVC